MTQQDAIDFIIKIKELTISNKLKWVNMDDDFENYQINQFYQNKSNVTKYLTIHNDKR